MCIVHLMCVFWNSEQTILRYFGTDITLYPHVVKSAACSERRIDAKFRFVAQFKSPIRNILLFIMSSFMIL